MDKSRQQIAAYFSDRRTEWADILISTYVLVQKDRIGYVGLSERRGVPGIWGHSYVRTYYNWVGKTPPDTSAQEGGIASSYYVIKALSAHRQLFEAELPKIALKETIDFFIARTKVSGVGIHALDVRGNPGIQTNLRHTCFGYLAMCELSALSEKNTKLEKAIVNAASSILKEVAFEELIEAWLSDSWPVGAIASYIAARDHLFNSPLGRQWAHDEGRIWPGVRKRLFDALIQLEGKRLEVLTSQNDTGMPMLVEHFPFWHPIYNLPVLRLHSTLGCLSLVGTGIADSAIGQGRIRSIVDELCCEVLDSADKAPRFAPSSPPSIAAAFAMLEILLGPWFNPSIEDLELIFSILSFVERNWRNPSVYQDYWTEFTAPLLSLPELSRGLNDKFFWAIERGHELMNSLDDYEQNPTIPNGNFEDLAKIIQVALGGPHTVRPDNR